MEIEITGLPMHSVCDDPVIQRWMDISTSFKDAIVRGYVVGILGVQPPEVTISNQCPKDLFDAASVEMSWAALTKED